MKKRFLSILLTAVLLLCAVPLGLGLVDTAYAAETVSSGSCGDNVTWMLTSDGTLTISGTGAMTDYYNSGATPWHSVCSQIKSVIIEDGVTRIGNYAFSYCDALAGVTIPDSVTTIGDQAFKDCKALTSMAIPGSVTMIGDWAFDGCGALTDIYYGGYGIDWLSASGNYCGIPSGTTVHFKSGYGKGSCGDNVSWVLPLDGTLTISGTGAMEDYDIDNAPWYSFRSQVKSVVIEDGVTRIGISAFKNCDALTDMTIPGSVIRIEDYAFSDCSALTSVTIPDGVTYIGSYAFSDCDSLASVTIPDSVTSIGVCAFEGCSSLTDIYYGGYGVDWLKTSGYDSVPSKTTVHFKDDLYGKGTCGDNVTWRLSDDGVLTISGTGKMKDYNDYNNCAPWDSVRSQIKSVVIERGVTSIGDYAFYYCDIMTSVTIPNSVTSIGDCAFEHCDALTSVTIPNSVTSIGDCAFEHCDALTSVTIPSGVTSIGCSAFEYCDALTSVKISDSVTSIGYDAFYGCDALTDVYYGGYGVDWLKASGYSTVVPSKTIVHFKDNLYGKGECGLNVNWVMTADGTLTISGKGRISNYNDYSNRAPWYACGKYIKSVVIESGVTGIGNYAFYYCEALTSVTILNTVTAIGDEAFRNCEALTSVAIPNSVTTIGDGAFSYCEALTGMTIPGSVKTISGRAFSGCTSLRSVTIPNGVTVIDESLFYGCTSLTSVTIPKSVTSIGWSAFFRCSSLKSVNIPSSVTSIDCNAFSECTSLTGVTIPNGVTAIYGGAFSGCSSLTSVTIPNSVTSIGASSFKGCTSLTSVTIPDSVTSIGSGAFKDCSALTEIRLPSALKAIESETFSNCVKLSSVTIPKSVTDIEEKAFYYCESLTDVYYDGTAADWAKLTVASGNDDMTNATLHCAAVPTAPVVKLGNSATSGKPVLTWNAVPSATSYKVYRATSKSGTYSLLGTVTTTSYTNTGAKEGTTYYYKVKAANGAGESAYSNVVSGKVVVTPKPAAPVVKIGNSSTSGKPMLTWNAVSGATSYKVYRATSQNGTYSLLGTTTATSYTNAGAKAGTTYYYRVKACNDAGLSPYSNIVSGQSKAVTPKPSAPVVKIGHSATSGKPMLTWNAVSGATSYKVYRATSQNGTYSLLGTVTATSYTNTGAKAGTTYYYKVKAVNSAGESAFSNVVSGKTTVTTLTMGHSASSGKPQLTWKAVSGAASYRVYRATAKNGAYSVINTTKALTYTNVGAALGTTYYYKVEALNAAGKSMGFSAIVEGKVAPVLAVGYSSVSGKPQLTWKAVPGATEYQVYRSTQQNSGYSKINTTTSTSYVNTGAKAGTTYYYRIVAVKGTAASDFSNIVSARPGK